MTAKGWYFAFALFLIANLETNISRIEHPRSNLNQCKSKDSTLLFRKLHQ